MRASQLRQSPDYLGLYYTNMPNSPENLIRIPDNLGPNLNRRIKELDLLNNPRFGEWISCAELNPNQLERFLLYLSGMNDQEIAIKVGLQGTGVVDKQRREVFRRIVNVADGLPPTKRRVKKIVN